jgi:hypothetical protein
MRLLEINNLNLNKMMINANIFNNNLASGGGGGYNDFTRTLSDSMTPGFFPSQMSPNMGMNH